MPSARSFTLGTLDEVTRSVSVIASTTDPVMGTRKRADGTEEKRLEALETWDLSRFSKHPIVLWQHDDKSPAIGLASEVSSTTAGLRMRLNFAAANVSPEAEDAFQRVKAGLIRGVSVGFDYGEETEEDRGGERVSVYRNNVLNEVSLVTIPADPNAVVLPEMPEEERRRTRASKAASELARHRYTRTDDTEGEDEERLDYVSRLDKFEVTPVGGLRIPARVARTGVLVYRNPDGSVKRRELRLPEECFRADSMQTLRMAAVTDIEGHRGLITPFNYREHNFGTVDNVRQDGDYLMADLHVNDAAAIGAVEAGNLKDISAGYRCRLERTSGVWDGQPYDCIQRNIRYNHVAVLPPGRGRAGADVGLRLDSIDEDDVRVTETQPMNAPAKTFIRLDGKDIEFGSEAHVSYLQTRCDAKEAEAVTLKSSLDALQARFDAAEAKAKKSKEDDEAAKKKDEDDRAKRAKASRALRRTARKALRALEDLEDDEKDEDDEKMDALEEELDDLSDRDVMVRVIRADSKDFDDKGKSDDYVTARFDCTLETAAKKAKEDAVRTDGVDSVVQIAEGMKRKGPPNQDPGDKAREEMLKRQREAWTKPLTG